MIINEDNDDSESSRIQVQNQSHQPYLEQLSAKQAGLTAAEAGSS